MVKAQVQKMSKNLMTILGLISIFINIFKNYNSKKSELNKNNKYTTTVINIYFNLVSNINYLRNKKYDSS